MIQGRPTAPNNLEVKKVTENAVTLRWDRPDSDGGARIKGYVIEKRDPHRHAYTQVGTCISTDFTVRTRDWGREQVQEREWEQWVTISYAELFTLHQDLEWYQIHGLLLYQSPSLSVPVQCERAIILVTKKKI